MKQKERIIIVGAGLSGLTLAYFLAQRNIQTTILEASSRIGGRIQTQKGALETPLELGATWFSDLHTHLISLLEELGLKKFPQYTKGISIFQTSKIEPPQQFSVPESEAPSYRVAGGTQMIIEALSKKLPSENIHLNTKISSIQAIGNELQLQTANGEKFHADKVVLSLPPELVASQIRFLPELPLNFSKLLPTVHTWMAGAIKFVIEYAAPFWRDENYSGMLFSHVGIVAEMYDHTNFEANKFGFTGFLNGGAAAYSAEVRKALVLKHLSGYLGEGVLSPIAYYDKVWTGEFISDGMKMDLMPHQNNGHVLLQESYLAGKLFFSGTETSAAFSGYMEGAVVAAEQVLGRVLG